MEGISSSRQFLRALLLVALALALIAFAPSKAFAPQVSCGDLITQDTRVENDLIDCPGDGLVIGADEITLDLNGHTIAAPAPASAPGLGNIGISNIAGHDGVTVEDGTVQGFNYAMYLGDASRNSVERTLLTHNGEGITLYQSHDNRIDHNTISGNLGGIGLIGFGATTQNQITHNVISDNDVGISGEKTFRNEVRHNRVVENSRFGMFFDGSYYDSVEENLIADNGEGIDIFGGIPEVVNNHVTGNLHDGIHLFGSLGAGLLVVRNAADRNGDDGIDADNAPLTLTDNKANENTDLGIEAVPGVADGGGNKAHGDGNPLQCVNVVCK